MMVNLNIRFQLAAFVLLLIIAIDFIRMPKLKTLSTKYFMLLILATTLNLVFDMTTVYTANHLDTVPEQTNMMFHQFFIGSVVLALFMNYRYIMILSKEQKRGNVKWYLVEIIPILISVFVILRRELYYVQTPYGTYSYGPMAYIVYLCGIVYLLAVFFMSFDRNNVLSHYQRVSIRLQCLLWLCGLGVQMMFPYILLSGLIVSFTLLITYISFENQKMYVDIEVGGFNRAAYQKMFSEHYESKKPMILVGVVFENYGRMGTELGIERSNLVMEDIRKMMQEAFGLSAYHSRQNAFTCFLSDSIGDDEHLIGNLENRLRAYRIDSYNLEIHVDILDARKYGTNKVNIYDLQEFMARQKYYQECRVVYLDESMMKKKQRVEKIIELIKTSIEEQAIYVYYQPIYNTVEKKYTSAEALVRIKDDTELGYVSPEEFIPIAEKNGMIQQIGQIVFEKTVHFIKENQISKYGVELIEINISGIQLATKDIDTKLISILQAAGLDSSFINLEITETAVGKSDELSNRNIANLKKAGFHFSIDDFGTGYSNLSQIMKEKYEIIKVDKSILWDAFKKEDNKELENTAARILLSNVLTMLSDMYTEIVVEGVETKEMMEFLTNRKVKYLQGYYFSKPLSEQDFLKIIGTPCEG